MSLEDRLDYDLQGPLIRLSSCLMLVISDPVLFLFLLYGAQLLCTLYSCLLFGSVHSLGPDRVHRMRA